MGIKKETKKLKSFDQAINVPMLIYKHLISKPCQ